MGFGAGGAAAEVVEGAACDTASVSLSRNMS